MTPKTLSANDFPTAETMPGKVTGLRGKSLDTLTLDSALSGELEMEDLRITPDALLRQAEIARSVGRSALAMNFERAAEMTRLPQEEVMKIYELLRPGRARALAELEEAAERLRHDFEAPRLASVVLQAAELYARRGMYRTRY